MYTRPLTSRYALLIALLVALSPANAASLDLLEVGGAWGTPGATNPSALWWNPAGLAVGGGHQYLVEGAPMFANVGYDRTNPDYGEGTDLLGTEADYNYGGQDEIKFSGVVPFLGVSSSLGVDGLGLGAALFVPTARGGVQQTQDGPGRYHLIEGDIQSIHASLGGAYHIADFVALGLSGAYTMNSWEAKTDIETLSALHDGINELLPGTSPYQDWMFEDPNYSGRLNFDSLHKNVFTFGAGIYVTPLGDKLGISLGYQHGYRLDYEGDVKISLGCPPDIDAIGRFAAESRGICDVTLNGKSFIGYNLPSRLNFGVVVQPIEKIRLEAMGAYVMWGVFSDYDIQTSVPRSEIELENDETAEETAELVSQNRQWARDNRNTFWLGVDGKFKVHKLFTLGARVFYDRSAIPSSTKSTNNYDLNTLGLMGLAAVTPFDAFGVGLSYTRHQMFSQTVTDSAFNLSLEDRANDRVYYPSANGTYTGNINRIALNISGQFGKDK